MTMMLNLVFAFTVTTFFIFLFRPVSIKVGLVDLPGVRKHHQGAVPLVGGIAMFCAFLFTVLTLNIPVTPWKPVFAASALLVIVGMLDDFRELNVRDRFAAQIGAMLMITVWAGYGLGNLGDLFGLGAVEPGLFAVPLTVFAGVGVMNAVNMMDGMDGLAGGMVAILLVLLVSLLWSHGEYREMVLVATVLACVSAFFLFNFRFSANQPVYVFLGDAGALFLGLVTASLLIKYSQPPYGLYRPVTALWLFGIPLMDAIAVMLRRIESGRSPFRGDREHLHHIFQRAGLSVRRSALLIFLLQISMSSAGMAGEYLGVAEWIMFFGFLALFSLYYLVMKRAWTVARILRRWRSVPETVAE